MFSSASSTEIARFGTFDRAIARLLVVSMLTLCVSPASAGDEFQDANDTTFDASVVGLDNSVAGETTFTIDTQQTEIGWQDLQQPANNRLEFHFVDPGRDAAVLNRIGATRPPSIDGTVISNGTVAFSSPFGLFIGANAVLDVGSLVAVGADVSRESFFGGGPVDLGLTGAIENHGTILADEHVSLIGSSVRNAGDISAQDGQILMLGAERVVAPNWDAITESISEQGDFFGLLGEASVENDGRLDARDAALVGGRVVNRGEIEIDDGSLLMVGADAVYLSRFDDPVYFRLPHRSDASDASQTRYAVENHGRIDAGQGHVRLSAADPLGFGIRQGTGPGSDASIHARRIEVEGGETGRVHLSGALVARDATQGDLGGEIEVSGAILALEDARLDASGRDGGGRILVGGERQGGGTLQRADAVVVDAASTLRANAKDEGDGGEVIVFAEEFTSVAGRLEARGGAEGGNGGFIETSGLRNFAISAIPDVSAARGEAGAWLIDPLDITIAADPVAGQDCATGTNCLNAAIQAILDPDFDATAFDGVLRTVDIAGANVVDPELLAGALAVGTDVTLSTQVFGIEDVGTGGTITIQDAILIQSAGAVPGTRASLTLLAARDIDVQAEIGFSDPSVRPVALDVRLQANDIAQEDVESGFDTDLVDGSVTIAADIRTGGGDLIASGVGIRVQSSVAIETSGGNVNFAAGGVRADTQTGLPIASVFDRNRSNDPTLQSLVNDGLVDLPTIVMEGSIDTAADPGTSNELLPGGSVALSANSLNVETRQSGPDPVEVLAGEVRVAGPIRTDGGDVTISGGLGPAQTSRPDFVGNVSLDLPGQSIETGGGDLTILANRFDPGGEVDQQDIIFVDSTALTGATSPVEGGEITIAANLTTGGGDLDLGIERTRTIVFDGAIDTRNPDDATRNGLTRIVAVDSSDPESNSVENGVSGASSITIGGDGSLATTIDTAGLSIRSRDVTIGSATGPSDVQITLAGTAEAEILPAEVDPFSNPGEAPAPIANSEEIEITAFRKLVMNAGVALSGETITLDVAEDPLAVSTDERDDLERLVFGGSNAGGVLSDGVSLSGDFITISVGDGTSGTDDDFSEGTPPPDPITDTGILRGSTGNYNGLFLSGITSDERPKQLAIGQDADFAITAAAPGAGMNPVGELFLAQAFGANTIGADGQRIALTTADGILRIDDATPFDRLVTADEDDDSLLFLNGGLFLPDDEMTPPPGLGRNSVVFGAGVVFDVDELTLTTPGEYTIDDTIAAALGTPRVLEIEAGRNTTSSAAAGRGTLTIGDGLAVTLRASERLSLRGGATGFGDLVFNDPGTVLAADEIELRAGAGASSENDGDDLSAIVGVQPNVTFQDGGGDDDFAGAASSATAFRYRQDAGIDGETDLPNLDQLSMAADRTLAGVTYEVRSDAGTVDLDDGIAGTNEGERFADADLTLVGLESGNAEAIDVSGSFAITGSRLTLGGIGDFTFDQTLASAFNRTADPLEQFTLRASLGASGGQLRFDRGSAPAVDVVAERIDLVAGDGPGGAGNVSINPNNARFILSGDRAFTIQSDSAIDFRDLPDADQFAGVLPRILALRSTTASLVLDDFTLDGLPIDRSDSTPLPTARLILEADQLTITRDDGGFIQLTNSDDLNLRLRANEILLDAGRPRGQDSNARILFGSRDTDPLPTPADPANPTDDELGASGDDAFFDEWSLLIEGFDPDAESDLATTDNLSELSRDADDPTQFDLTDGRGPTTLTILQPGEVLADELPDFRAVSGLYRRTIEDEDGDESTPIPTDLAIISDQSPLTVDPQNVRNSDVFISGRPDDPDALNDVAITLTRGGFAAGDALGDYVLDNLVARTSGSLLVQSDVVVDAVDTLQLSAGFIIPDTDEDVTQMGDLFFEADPGTGNPTIQLAGNRVLLTAGPGVEVTDPDGPDDDDDREPVSEAIVSRIDLAGLAEIAQNGEPTDAVLFIEQSASFDDTAILATLDANALGFQKWEQFTIASTQGALTLDDVDQIAQLAVDLSARADGSEGTLVVEVPLADADPTRADFSDFARDPLDPATAGRVTLASNDITLRTRDASANLDLDEDNLSLIGVNAALGTESERARVLSDPEVQDRPIVRFVQQQDLANATLPERARFLSSSVTGLVPRSTFDRLDIVLENESGDLTFDDTLRDAVSGSNLSLLASGDVEIALTTITPGFDVVPGYADLQLESLDVSADEGRGTIRVTSAPDGEALTIETVGDQRWNGEVELGVNLETEGRDVRFTGVEVPDGMGGTRFTGNVVRADGSSPDIGLTLTTDGKSAFEGDVGEDTRRLAHLHVIFDSAEDDRTPTVEFGRRVDSDGDDVRETAVASDQGVWVRDDILFYAIDLAEESPTTNLRAASVGRERSANFATIGKGSGDLTFTSSQGRFDVGEGERIAVGGTLRIDVGTGDVVVSDVAAIDFEVVANTISLLRRPSGITRDITGETQPDAGPAIVVNTLDWNGLEPNVIGRGRDPRFGLPSIADADLPDFDRDFSFFEIKPSGRPLSVADFVFDTSNEALLEQIPSLVPRGASRSDLSGAIGPRVLPTPTRTIPEPFRLGRVERLLELAVEARETPTDVRLARLAGAAVIDDLVFGRDDDDLVAVTDARLDARDAELAISLYEELFGPDGERSEEVRGVLQAALDRYLETTRARRVVGFELRRFVKNRPSSQLDAYATLEALDTLFRYHRRLGLSPGEYRRIQREWLRDIQPDGISLEELAEAIHPSRYVRGSDILDIFGR